LHAHWNDDFHHALHTALTGEKAGYYSDFGGLEDVCKALRKAFVYDGRYSPFRKRRQGRAPEGLDGSRFLAYLQNHDQIGNRALGERSGQLMSDGKLKVAAAIVLTSPFLPMLFQGEEWGATTPFLYFSDHQDPVLGEMVREGRRREFAAFVDKSEEIPDPQAPESFARSKLDWKELNQPRHSDLQDWHRMLIRLRRSNPSLCDGRLEEVCARCDERERWLVMERGPWSIACNLGTAPVSIQLRKGALELVAASEVGVLLDAPVLTLPSDSVAILKS
jgi:maltooligosyltrehalose trehalohydrolase